MIPLPAIKGGASGEGSRRGIGSAELSRFISDLKAGDFTDTFPIKKLPDKAVYNN